MKCQLAALGKEGTGRKGLFSTVCEMEYNSGYLLLQQLDTCINCAVKANFK